MKELVTVVVPILNPQLSTLEQTILDNCVEKLGKYSIIFIYGESASADNLIARYEGVDFIKFPDKYFESRRSLSNLFLMEDFYERFNWADYMLIHELNSWIVKDELHYWCKQGYDYLTVEPLGGGIGDLTRMMGLSAEKKNALDEAFFNNGIRLCHVERFRKILLSKSQKAYEYRQQTNWIQADSLFWALEANRFIPKLRFATNIVINRFAKFSNINDLGNNQDRHSWPFALTNVQAQNIEDLPSFI